MSRYFRIRGIAREWPALNSSKTCGTCHAEKPLAGFYRSKTTKDGHASRCIECTKSALAVYRAENAERIKETRRLYNAKNKSAVNEYSRQYHAKNRTERVAKIAEYRRNNPDKLRLAKSRWNQAHPEAVRAMDMAKTHRRRTRKRENGVYRIDQGYLVRLLNQPCFYCGENGNMTLDHVVPIARGGTHGIGNLVPACRSCNSSKNDRFITEWKRKKQIA